jgi:hypothetical protein
MDETILKQLFLFLEDNRLSINEFSKIFENEKNF